MEFNRTGVSRDVLCIGGWALKFPKLARGWRQFLIGLLSNMQERDLSKRGWPKLCPVVFALPGGWLVVMRRASPFSDEQAEMALSLAGLGRFWRCGAETSNHEVTAPEIPTIPEIQN
jgi:hypothetical protein